ncbi:FtsQ-type POTRA domain-containing protein [Heliobacterium gestii]|uniref:FtsQ-type POTRA domain-containing protein n=1 Tax=Heliomicrobium gestii TaxID=2699 RepID=A0A845LCL3_HELGE|nr:FtsQ-type POTRA domain-containing protein [Heliomicrobium gestii]MBM7867524.1 cell division protein FtsQ [Heliomicrobium gestii]MZP43928.1 FtsQ-type POTRA domain-containing protein [Heliomicrobium gestii]
MRRQQASVLGFFFISLLLLAAYYFLQSPYFGVSQVTVTGISLIKEEEIVRLSGIQPGENILRLDQNRICEQLRFHPQVEDVTIQREFPSTVQIQIQERKPVAVIGQAGVFVLLDRQGILLRKLDSLYGIPLPVITGVQAPLNVGPGQVVSADGLAAGLKLCQEMPPTLLARVGEIHVINSSRLVLYTTDSIEVRFGPPDEIAAKSQALLDILDQWMKNGSTPKLNYIDISSAKSPVVKPKEETKISTNAVHPAVAHPTTRTAGKTGAAGNGH